MKEKQFIQPQSYVSYLYLKAYFIVNVKIFQIFYMIFC